MADRHLVTGRIIPERKTFGHENLPPLYIKNPESGVNACVTLGVINNPLIATMTGDIGDQSDVALKEIVTQAEQIVLNAAAFTSGVVFDVDVLAIVRENPNAPPGSMDFHYIDNVHDVISTRNPLFDVAEIWKLCQGYDGYPLRMCLNDLRMALKNIHDGPFYCYRAIETLRNHIGTRHGVIEDNRSARSRQWQIFRNELGLDEKKIREIEKLSIPIRHGKPVCFKGVEWRHIISITWDVTEAYMTFLDQILRGQKRWPDNPSQISEEVAQDC